MSIATKNLKKYCVVCKEQLIETNLTGSIGTKVECRKHGEQEAYTIKYNE